MDKFHNDLEIFLSETMILNNLMIGFIFFIFITLSISDFYFQKHNVPLYIVIAENMAWIIALTLILTCAEFIHAWRSHWVGGEIIGAFVMLIVAFVALYYLRKILLNYVGLEFTSDKLMLFAPLIILFIPVVVFLVYLIILGSEDWRY